MPVQDEDIEMESTPEPAKPKPIPKMKPEVIIEAKKNIPKPKVTFKDVEIVDTPSKGFSIIQILVLCSRKC